MGAGQAGGTPTVYPGGEPAAGWLPSDALHVTQRTNRMLQMPLQVRGYQPAALYLVPTGASVRFLPLPLEEREHQRDGMRAGRGGTGRAAGRAHHATRRDGERGQRPRSTAPGTFAQ